MYSHKFWLRRDPSFVRITLQKRSNKLCRRVLWPEGCFIQCQSSYRSRSSENGSFPATKDTAFSSISVIQFPASHQLRGHTAGSRDDCDGVVATNDIYRRYGKQAIVFTSDLNWKIGEERPSCSTWKAKRPVEIEKVHKTTMMWLDPPGIVSLWQWSYDILLRPFVPANYPDSVPAGYTRFMFASFVASVAGSAGMVLATQTLLITMMNTSGVAMEFNTASTSLLAGAINWIFKDGIGQLGCVLLTSKLSTRLDIDAKYWRMVAALALDGAAIMELLTPWCLPSSLAVLTLACIANVGKNVGYVTASSSRAALHQSLAKYNNLADVTAKAASQSMVAGLLGMTLGLSLSSVVSLNGFNSHQPTIYLVSFILLSAIHQYSTYLSLQAVAMNHFTRHRLNIVLRQYLESKQVPSPSDVADQESILWPDEIERDNIEWLSVGTDMRVVVRQPNRAAIANDAKYILTREYPVHNSRSIISTCRLHLIFFENSTGPDMIEGMLHAFVLRKELLRSGTMISSQLVDLVDLTKLQTRKRLPHLLTQMREMGWQTDEDAIHIEPSNAMRLALVNVIHDDSKSE